MSFTSWPRKDIVREAERLDLARGDYTCASIVPRNFSFSEDEIAQCNLATLTDRIKKQIARSKFGDAIVIGGVDFSYNTYENGPGVWQGHIYLLINRLYTSELDTEIRRAIPSDPSAYRPYSIRALRSGDFFRALTYSYKASFYARSSYDDGRSKKDGTPRINSRHQRLKSLQLAQIAASQINNPIGSRIIFNRVRRLTPPGVKLALKLLAPIKARSVAEILFSDFMRVV